MNQTMVGLKTHSINLYRELARGSRISDQLPPRRWWHSPRQYPKNSCRDTGTFPPWPAAWMSILKSSMRLNCARRHPLISTENLIGGLWDPMDGDIDPAQLCQALARACATRGGRSLPQHAGHGPDPAWRRHLDRSPPNTETLIAISSSMRVATRVNEVASMMGVHHPVASMEHQYFLTEEIPAIRDAGHRMPLSALPHI